MNWTNTGTSLTKTIHQGPLIRPHTVSVNVKCCVFFLRMDGKTHFSPMPWWHRPGPAPFWTPACTKMCLEPSLAPVSETLAGHDGRNSSIFFAFIIQSLCLFVCLTASPHTSSTPNINSVRHADSRGSLISTDSGNSLSEKNHDKGNSLDKVRLTKCRQMIYYRKSSPCLTCVINLPRLDLCGWPRQTDKFARRHSVNVLRCFTETEQTVLSVCTKRVPVDVSPLSVPRVPESPLRHSITSQVLPSHNPPPPHPPSGSVRACVCPKP